MLKLLNLCREWKTAKNTLLRMKRSNSTILKIQKKKYVSFLLFPGETNGILKETKSASFSHSPVLNIRIFSVLNTSFISK
jgi:hypothetical protein